MNIIEKVKTYLLILLIIVCAVYTVSLKNTQTKYNNVVLEKEILDKKLKNIIQIKSNEITMVYRDKEVVRTEIKYLPPEGSFKITTDANDKQQITIIDRGWTFGPNIGLTVSDKISPTLGVKFFYWNRFGTGVGINSTGLNAYIDRRIDDVINFLPNSSAGIFLGTKELGLRFSSFL